MSEMHERKLLQREQVVDLLQIPDADLQWLVNTCQLLEIRIKGHSRFDSRDVDRLIDTYKTTQSRRNTE